MGSITEPVLTLCGFHCYRVENEADVKSTTDAACKMAFGGATPGGDPAGTADGQPHQAERSLRWIDGSSSRAF